MSGPEPAPSPATEEALPASEPETSAAEEPITRYFPVQELLDRLLSSGRRQPEQATEAKPTSSQEEPPPQSAAPPSVVEDSVTCYFPVQELLERARANGEPRTHTATGDPLPPSAGEDLPVRVSAAYPSHGACWPAEPSVVIRESAEPSPPDVIESAVPSARPRRMLPIRLLVAGAAAYRRASRVRRLSMLLLLTALVILVLPFRPDSSGQQRASLLPSARAWNGQPGPSASAANRLASALDKGPSLPERAAAGAGSADPIISLDATSPGPATQRAAADAVALGRLQEALGLYRRLARAQPEDPAFSVAVQILERRSKERVP